MHWSIDGNPVAPGSQIITLPRVEPVDMLVPQTKNYTLVDGPDGWPVLHEVPLLPEFRGATVTATLEPDKLTIDCRPEDGAYYLDLRVGVREPGAATDRRWYDAHIKIDGRTEEINGLARAQSECMARWLDGLMVEAPSDEAIIAAVYAQLGRPLDPIWDPDPILMPPDDWATLSNPADDPDFATLEPFTVDPGTVDPGTDLTTTDPGTDLTTTEPGTTDTGVDVTTIDPGETLVIVTDTDGDSVPDSAVVITRVDLDQVDAGGDETEDEV